MNQWLQVQRGSSPLIVSFPHTGTDIPHDIEQRLTSAWIARKDADWWVQHVYEMAGEMGATTVRTTISRTVIDVNRDPSGASLYPGMATTDLCPLTTFDGEPLYRPSCAPVPAEITARRAEFFEPYHAALSTEIERLRAAHGRVVLYDAHSILSRVPRLFEGVLPHFNIGTYDGASCHPSLTRAIEAACEHPHFTSVVNGRFKGGWTTRHYGQPDKDVHALQMELACRTYMDEPQMPLSVENWPPPYDAQRAAPARVVLSEVLRACVDFANSPLRRSP